MGRKKTITDRGARQYIRIENINMWEIIEKIATQDGYKNSFNRIINEALFYGLPKLYAAVFSIPEEDDKPEIQPIKQDITGEHFLKMVRLLREVIINENINKSLMCSLFNLKEIELEGTEIGKQFSKGNFQDTPDCLWDYEVRELRKLRDKEE